MRIPQYLVAVNMGVLAATVANSRRRLLRHSTWVLPEAQAKSTGLQCHHLESRVLQDRKNRDHCRIEKGNKNIINRKAVHTVMIKIEK